MKRKSVGVIDYGAGNIDSLKNILNKIGYKALGCSSKNDIKNCDALILPGVGAFPQAMLTLKRSGLDCELKNFFNSGKPLLGICLGFQLFSEKSYEFGVNEGLSLIKGEVLKFVNNGFHIGWNELALKGSWGEKFRENNYFFFNHSYYLNINNSNVLGVSSIESKKRFPCFYKYENLAGMQFHPEKSQINGLKFLQNLLSEMLDD